MMFIFAVFGIACLAVIVMKRFSAPPQTPVLPSDVATGLPRSEVARWNETLATANGMLTKDAIRRFGAARAVDEMYAAECYIASRHGDHEALGFAQGLATRLRQEYARNNDPRFAEAITRFESIPRRGVEVDKVAPRVPQTAQSATPVLAMHERAMEDRQLNEYYRHMIEEGDVSERDVAKALEDLPQKAREVEREARRRGIPCVLLTKHLLPWSWGSHEEPMELYPGPEPQPDLDPMCECDFWREQMLGIPPEVTASGICPVCGEALETFDDDLAPDLTEKRRNEWRVAMAKWDAFKQLFPLTAADVEAEEKRSREEENARLIAKSRERIASAKSHRA